MAVTNSSGERLGLSDEKLDNVLRLIFPEYSNSEVHPVFAPFFRETGVNRISVGGIDIAYIKRSDKLSGRRITHPDNYWLLDKYLAAVRGGIYPDETYFSLGQNQEAEGYLNMVIPNFNMSHFGLFSLKDNKKNWARDLEVTKMLQRQGFELEESVLTQMLFQKQNILDFTKNNNLAPGRDVSYAKNYGVYFKTGKVYFLDMHLFSKNTFTMIKDR
jgi:hypothetical protein